MSRAFSLPRRWLAFLVPLLALTACDEELVTAPEPAVRTLAVFPNPATVRVGEDLLMVARIEADSGADLRLQWASSDPRRVSVSETGIVTGVSIGPAVITVVSSANPSLAIAVPVTVDPRYTGIRGLSASPNVVSILPGATQVITASVTADPDIDRSVTYSSAVPAVATVTASGLVTAVAPGSTIITVRSVADTGVVALVPVTVRPPAPARVSIQAVTSRGTQSPVDLNDVRGQVDVLVNVEPGERTVARVELVVNNNGRDTVVATQNFSTGQLLESMSLAVSRATTTEELLRASQVGVIVQSFRTDAFDAVSGAVPFRNLPTRIRAVVTELTTSGVASQSASSEVRAQLNNPDGFIVSARTLSSTGVVSALDGNGRRWQQAGRGIEFRTVPVLFSGRPLGARVISFPGDAPVASVTRTTNTGTSTDTLVLPAQYVSPSTGVDYVEGELPSVSAADPTGNVLTLVAPLPGGSGGGVLNAQATFTQGTRLEGLRVDNAPPPAPMLTLSTVLANSNNWINGEYMFESGLSALLPDIGVGLPGANLGATAASANVVFRAADSAGVDTLQVTMGSQLAASNTNTQYALLAEVSDRLRNTRVVPLSSSAAHPGTRFGVDLAPPTLRYASGSLTGLTLVSTNADSAFNSATGALGPRAFAVDVIDDRSGLPDDRLTISVRRFAQPNVPGTFRGTTSCITGDGTSCAPVLVPFESVLPDGFRQVTTLLDGGTGLEGYFTFEAVAQDQAGNRSVLVRKRALVDNGTDASAPFLTGLGVSGVLVGGDTARFLALATDNVELATGGIMLSYPNLPGPTQVLAYSTPVSAPRVIGARFDTLLTSPIAGPHPAFSIAHFIRSLEIVGADSAPQPYAASTVKPVSANAWVTDFAPGGAPVTLPANAAIVAGSIQDAPGPTRGFASLAGTSRELTKWRRTPGVSGLQFEAIGPSGQTVSPFRRVLLARRQSSGLPVNPEVWQVVGELTVQIGNDNGLRRSWVYNFGSLSAGDYVAIGISANGDAISTLSTNP